MAISRNHKLSSIDDPHQLVAKALQCLETTAFSLGSVLLNHSQDVKTYLQLKLASEPNEVFAVLFLSNSHHLLAFETLFYGTINEAHVYPRLIVQKALSHNAAAIILAHNQVSNSCEPSRSDREVTLTIRKILKVIDVQLLDHVIVTKTSSFSFAENGLI